MIIKILIILTLLIQQCLTITESTIQGQLSEDDALAIVKQQFVALNGEAEPEPELETEPQQQDAQSEAQPEGDEQVQPTTEEEIDPTQQEIKKLAEKVDENTYQTKQFSNIVLQDQISKLERELADVQAQMDAIKESLPDLEDSDECSSIMNCKKCTKNLKCGWCVMEEKCVRGDNIGPLYTLCNFYDYFYCSGKTCSRLTDCSSCLADPQCGWCEDQNHMLVACLESSTSQCPSNGWFQIEAEKNSCPKKQSDAKPENVMDEKSSRKKKKKSKGEEVIEKEAPRDWEANYQNEKSNILSKRQKELRGTSKGQILSASQQEMESLHQRQLSLQEQLTRLHSQLESVQQ